MIDREQVLLYIKNAKQALVLYEKYEDAGLLDFINNLDLEFSYYELMHALYVLEDRIENNEELNSNLIENYEQLLEEKSILHHSKGDVFMWIIFVTEYFRIKNELTRKEVDSLFLSYGIFKFLGAIYPAAHTQSEKYAASLIEDKIKRTKNLEREIIQKLDGSKYGYENCDILIVKRNDSTDSLSSRQ